MIAELKPLFCRCVHISFFLLIEKLKIITHNIRWMHSYSNRKTTNIDIHWIRSCTHWTWIAFTIYHSRRQFKNVNTVSLYNAQLTHSCVPINFFSSLEHICFFVCVFIATNFVLIQHNCVNGQVESSRLSNNRWNKTEIEPWTPHNHSI